MENQFSLQERLNTALYKKMFAEQEKYREWLLGQPAAEVLNHTYEYTIREDILIALESSDLNPAQARALLALPDPLNVIFREYEKMEPSYMEDIMSAIEYRAELEAKKWVRPAKDVPHEAER